MSRKVFYMFCNFILAGIIGTILALWGISNEKIEEERLNNINNLIILNEEIALRDSYLEDVEGFLDENQLKWWKEHKTRVGYGEGR